MVTPVAVTPNSVVLPDVTENEPENVAEPVKFRVELLIVRTDEAVAAFAVPSENSTRKFPVLFMVLNPVPDVPLVPVEPELPVEPLVPDVPDEPEVPDVPVEPDEPEVPEEPDEPVEPELPVEPLVPDVPEEPEFPLTPDVPLDPAPATQVAPSER